MSIATATTSVNPKGGSPKGRPRARIDEAISNGTHLLTSGPVLARRRTEASAFCTVCRFRSSGLPRSLGAPIGRSQGYAELTRIEASTAIRRSADIRTGGPAQDMHRKTQKIQRQERASSKETKETHYRLLNSFRFKGHVLKISWSRPLDDWGTRALLPAAGPLAHRPDAVPCQA